MGMRERDGGRQREIYRQKKKTQIRKKKKRW
jgi:hypothetical protein